MKYSHVFRNHTSQWITPLLGPQASLDVPRREVLHVVMETANELVTFELDETRAIHGARRRSTP